MIDVEQAKDNAPCRITVCSWSVNTTINLRDPKQVAELFERSAGVVRTSKYLQGSALHLPAAGQMVVTGDLHGNIPHLEALVQLADLSSSPNNHLLLQEIIHGQPLVNDVDLTHRALARVAELVAAWPDQVHVILANHELSQLRGTSVGRGSGDNVQQFNDGLTFVYGDSWVDVSEAINCFIEALPLALLTERGLWCSHSLPPARVMERFDFSVLERPMTETDRKGPGGAAYQLVWGRSQTESQIMSLRERFGVELVCIGHAKVESGAESVGKHLLMLNSDHTQGAAVVIDLTQIPSAVQAVAQSIQLTTLVNRGASP